MPVSIYISDDEIQSILKKYSLDTASGVEMALDADQIEELQNEVDAEIESALCGRYVVPLRGTSGGYASVPDHVGNKIKICYKAMTRVVLARDHGINTQFSSHSDLISVNQRNFDKHIKDFLDIKRIWDMKLQDFASNASQPIQSVGIARGNNDFESR